MIIFHLKILGFGLQIDHSQNWFKKGQMQFSHSNLKLSFISVCQRLLEFNKIDDLKLTTYHMILEM